jgi:CRISPR-associated endonuclease Csn1
MRNDHRHHAVDGLVIALMTPKRVHAMANARGENMPQPWSAFLQQARECIRNLNISNRVQRRVSGAIHEATFYGPTAVKQTYVRRKHVTELTNTKQLAKVRDETIRSILADHLHAQGVDASKPVAILKTAFKGENEPRMRSGGVPIRRVRMLESSETIRAVSDKRGFQFVKPGNNHHIVYRAMKQNDEEKWTAEVVTMWDVALRARQGKPPVNQSDTEEGRFVMSLALGESFEIDDDDGGRLLCVVRKLNQRSKQLHYRIHTDAREAKEIDSDNLSLSTQKIKELNGIKVTVDPLGRIRNASD